MPDKVPVTTPTLSAAGYRDGMSPALQARLQAHLATHDINGLLVETLVGKKFTWGFLGWTQEVSQDSWLGGFSNWLTHRLVGVGSGEFSLTDVPTPLLHSTLHFTSLQMREYASIWDKVLEYIADNTTLLETVPALLAGRGLTTEAGLILSADPKAVWAVVQEQVMDGLFTALDCIDVFEVVMALWRNNPYALAAEVLVRAVLVALDYNDIRQTWIRGNEAMSTDLPRSLALYELQALNEVVQYRNLFEYQQEVLGTGSAAGSLSDNLIPWFLQALQSWVDDTMDPGISWTSTWQYRGAQGGDVRPTRGITYLGPSKDDVRGLLDWATQELWGMFAGVDGVLNLGPHASEERVRALLANTIPLQISSFPDRQDYAKMTRALFEPLPLNPGEARNPVSPLFQTPRPLVPVMKTERWSGGYLGQIGELVPYMDTAAQEGPEDSIQAKIYGFGTRLLERLFKLFRFRLEYLEEDGWRTLDEALEVSTDRLWTLLEGIHSTNAMPVTSRILYRDRNFESYVALQEVSLGVADWKDWVGTDKLPLQDPSPQVRILPDYVELFTRRTVGQETISTLPNNLRHLHPGYDPTPIVVLFRRLARMLFIRTAELCQLFGNRLRRIGVDKFLGIAHVEEYRRPLMEWFALGCPYWAGTQRRGRRLLNGAQVAGDKAVLRLERDPVVRRHLLAMAAARRGEGLMALRELVQRKSGVNLTLLALLGGIGWFLWRNR